MEKTVTPQIDALKDILTTLAEWEDTLPDQDQSFAKKTRQAFLTVVEELQATREKLRQKNVELSAAYDSLEQEQDVLTTTIENAHAQLAYLDPDFNFIWVNAAYARGSGYAKETLIGRNHFELFPDDDNQATFERVRDTGKAVTFQAKPFNFPDSPERGTTYWDWVLTPVQSKEGQLRGLVLSLYEVTERVETRRMLRQYADRLEVLHEIDQAILAADSVQELAATTVRRLPQLASCLLTGVILFDFDNEEVLPLATYAAGETRLVEGGLPMNRAWMDVTTRLAQEESYIVENAQELLSPLATDLKADAVHAYIFHPLIVRGELIGALGIGRSVGIPLTAAQMEITRDVADQLAVAIQQARLYKKIQNHAEELEQQVKRRTAALRASQARFKAIFEDAAIGIALVDDQGHVITSNPALHKILGYDEEELTGMALAKLTPPDNVVNDMQLYTELMAGKRDYYQLEGQYLRKDKQPIYANLTVSLVRWHNTKPRFAIVMIEDIDERKQAQHALIQSERVAITGRMAASLAHEINNPLQSVIGFISLAREVLEEKGDVREYLKIAFEELERTASIVARLRDLNQPVKQNERKPADINALLKRVLMLSKNHCRNRKVEIILELEKDLPPISLENNRIQQVFLNLVLNAVDAMPNGGQLQLRTNHTQAPEGVQILFTDTGLGMSPDKLAHLFEPFYTTKDQGMGLGLYVSHRIIKEHDGRIEVETHAGKGTTFTVWLPA